MQPFNPVFANARCYTVNKEDIEGMMRSGTPGEEVLAGVVANPKSGELFWRITVSRPLYGELHDHVSFVPVAIVKTGPEWVEEQHRIIDEAFELTRKEHPKAAH